MDLKADVNQDFEIGNKILYAATYSYKPFHKLIKIENHVYLTVVASSLVSNEFILELSMYQTLLKIGDISA